MYAILDVLYMSWEPKALIITLRTCYVEVDREVFFLMAILLTCSFSGVDMTDIVSTTDGKDKKS